MDPISATTLATISLATSAAGAGIGAIGALSSARAQSQAANYQAAVQRNNQIIAQQNAQRAAATGRAQAQQQDIMNQARMGGIVAAQAASGIDIGTGSPTEVRQSAAQLGRLDTENVMDRAMQQVRQQQVAAMSAGAQAQLDTMTATAAQRAGIIGATGSILGGASSFSDKWLRYQTQGIPGFGSTATSPGTGPINYNTDL